MYHYILGITLLKSLTPYFRKHILLTLTSYEFLLANSVVIFTFLISIFIYKLCFDKKSIYSSVENICKLKTTQILSLLSISALVIISSLLINEFDKNHNTPLINHIFIEVVSVISLIFVGIFIFKEKYSYTQMFGFILAAIGIFLMYKKNN